MGFFKDKLLIGKKIKLRLLRNFINEGKFYDIKNIPVRIKITSEYLTTGEKIAKINIKKTDRLSVTSFISGNTVYLKYR